MGQRSDRTGNLRADRGHKQSLAIDCFREVRFRLDYGDAVVEIAVSATREGGEFQTLCGCCQRPIHWGHGWLESEAGALAAYWYQWPEGHDGRHFLAVARFDEHEQLVPGVVCIAASIGDGELRYAICDAEDAPWKDFGSFGSLVNRGDALDDQARIFALVDAIEANESAISSRILSCGLRA